MNKIKIEIELEIGGGVASVSSSMDLSIEPHLDKKDVSNLVKEHVSEFSKEFSASFIDLSSNSNVEDSSVHYILSKAVEMLGVDFEKLKEHGASSDYEQTVLDYINSSGVDIDHLIFLSKTKQVVQ